MQHYFGHIEKDNVALSNQDIFHISKVMRMKKDDLIVVISNHEHFLCSVDSVSPLSIKVIKELLIDNELKNEITIFLPLAKGDKISFMIQKATELGVSHIVLYECNRSIVKMSNDDFNKKLERYNLIAKEASEQSERNVIPSIEGVAKIKDLPKQYLKGHNFVAYEEEQGKPTDIEITNKQISLLIGPEGGLENKEIDILVSQGFKPISLGKRILRCETALIYGLSVLSYLSEKNEQ